MAEAVQLGRLFYTLGRRLGVNLAHRDSPGGHGPTPNKLRLATAVAGASPRLNAFLANKWLLDRHQRSNFRSGQPQRSLAACWRLTPKVVAGVVQPHRAFAHPGSGEGLSTSKPAAPNSIALNRFGGVIALGGAVQQLLGLPHCVYGQPAYLGSSKRGLYFYTRPETASRGLCRWNFFRCSRRPLAVLRRRSRPGAFPASAFRS